jgi:hypothetical protein
MAWMLTVTSAQGTTRSSDDLRAVGDTLETAGYGRPMLDVTSGQLRATMVIQAPTKREAIDLAATTLRAAMEAAGLPVPGGLQIQVEVHGEVPEEGPDPSAP